MSSVACWTYRISGGWKFFGVMRTLPSSWVSFLSVPCGNTFIWWCSSLRLWRSPLVIWFATRNIYHTTEHRIVRSCCFHLDKFCDVADVCSLTSLLDLIRNFNKLCSEMKRQPLNNPSKVICAVYFIQISDILITIEDCHAVTLDKYPDLEFFSRKLSMASSEWTRRLLCLSDPDNMAFTRSLNACNGHSKHSFECTL